MKIKKLNKTHSVFNRDIAKWSATFRTNAGYSFAILKMAQAFEMGRPYTNTTSDSGKVPWLFRNKGLSSFAENHIIYLTNEEQVTFCLLTFSENE